MAWGGVVCAWGGVVCAAKLEYQFAEFRDFRAESRIAAVKRRFGVFQLEICAAEFPIEPSEGRRRAREEHGRVAE